MLKKKILKNLRRFAAKIAEKAMLKKIVRFAARIAGKKSLKKTFAENPSKITQKVAETPRKLLKIMFFSNF